MGQRRDKSTYGAREDDRHVGLSRQMAGETAAYGRHVGPAPAHGDGQAGCMPSVPLPGQVAMLVQCI